MAVFVAFLRAVNVGGTGKLPMAELRALCEELGFTDARTYVQSGNVVLGARQSDETRVAKRLADGIERRFGFRPGVTLRTTAELRRVVRANPFARTRGVQPARLLVMFLGERPARAAAKRLETVRRVREELRLVGRELYVWFPDGIGRSKLSTAALERAVGRGTGRNWNSVTRLLAMAEELEATG
jgi:uncharacterized protein (DUF1697 family)